MAVAGFADLWEHVRLLSDGPRNEALIELLRRRAPGARVLEVGCGSGLLSCVAARLGAERVFAVEPTAQAELARELVRANHLEDRVVVLDGMVEELQAQPVDLAFSELLNADPFLEGIVPAMEAAARWVVPGGHLAPSKLRVRVALVRSQRSAMEVQAVRQTLDQLASAHGLDLGPLRHGLDHLEPYRYTAPSVETLGTSADVLTLDLRGADVPEEVMVVVPKAPRDEAWGAVLWFEATLDDDLLLSNRPDDAGHWGVMVHEWAQPAGRGDSELRLRIELDDEDGATVHVA